MDWTGIMLIKGFHRKGLYGCTIFFEILNFQSFEVKKKGGGPFVGKYDVNQHEVTYSFCLIYYEQSHILLY